MKSYIKSFIIIAAVLIIPISTFAAGDNTMTLKPVSYSKVEITDKFWKKRMETNRTVTIPLMLDLLDSTKSIQNIELAGKHAREGFIGPPWTDSDVYKAIEAASYSLSTTPDPELDARLDEIIEKIAKAQQPDGYINSYFQVVEPENKFVDLALKHELYTAGHLFEAAVAHYEATNKRTLLDVAVKMADHIDSIFGDSDGKSMGYPGHPEIELALIKLWRATGEKRYIDLAWFFLDNRGKGIFNVDPSLPLKSDYFQDDMPIRDHSEIKGHAVRALYLFSGVADVLVHKPDAGLDSMLDRVWSNAAGKRMYITGGMGPGGGIEGFTTDYDLPNLSAYQETCASIAMAMWSQRMGLLRGKSEYFDVMERALYNGSLDGVSLDGKKFFYANPLASIGNVERSDWFGCACCPPNISRTIASIGGYIYAADDDTIQMNMYIGNKLDVQLGDNRVQLKVKTNYPWDGKVSIELRPENAKVFELRLRIPEWCKKPSLTVNGKKQKVSSLDKGFISIKREWCYGNEVILNMPMKVQMMESHPKVVENKGRIAIQRGPLVYCFEEIDQKSLLRDIYIPEDTEFKTKWEPDLLGGIVVIKGEARAAEQDANAEKLYREADKGKKTTVTAIPYYSWSNRKPTPMEVWMPVCK